MHRFARFAAIFLGTVYSLSATVLYSPTVIGSSARVSDYGASSGNGFRAFDNFTIGTGASVERVSWLGFWMDFDQPVPAPAPAPDVQNWEIAFHADNGGIPGAQLLLQSFSAASVSSTFQGSTTFTTGSTYNVSLYEYSVDLTTAFPALASTQYWISILSRSDLYNPAFVILGATGGDDASWQQQLGPALSILSSGPVFRDRAFVLEGTVPEPATVLVSAAGLLVLLLQRARRHTAR